MSQSVRNENKLIHSNRRLTDDDVQELRLEHENDYYEEIDFSGNELTVRGLRAVLRLCRRCSKLRVLKLFKNRIGDEGAEALADLCKHLPFLEEMHLSHNQITERGIDLLVTSAVANRDDRAIPLWLRVEQNEIRNPFSVFEEFTKRLSVCLREDDRVCTTRQCSRNSKVHLPFFRRQRVENDSTQERRTNSHKTVVLTARAAVQSAEVSQKEQHDERGTQARKRSASLTTAHNRESRVDNHERHAEARRDSPRTQDIEMVTNRLPKLSPSPRGRDFHSSRTDSNLEPSAGNPRSLRHIGGEQRTSRHNGGEPRSFGRSGGEPHRDRVHARDERGGARRREANHARDDHASSCRRDADHAPSGNSRHVETRDERRGPISSHDARQKMGHHHQDMRRPAGRNNKPVQNQRPQAPGREVRRADTGKRSAQGVDERQLKYRRRERSPMDGCRGAHGAHSRRHAA